MATKYVSLTDKEREFIKNQSNWIGKIPQSIIKKMETADKTLKISSRKAKGRGLQMWVCNKIAELLHIPFENQDDQCLIHCREMGQSGVDIILRGKAYKKFKFDIECKNTESFNLYQTILQVKANQGEDRDWMIVHKRKTLKNPVVIIEWQAFEKIYKGELNG